MLNCSRSRSLLLTLTTYCPHLAALFYQFRLDWIVVVCTSEAVVILSEGRGCVPLSSAAFNISSNLCRGIMLSGYGYELARTESPGSISRLYTRRWMGWGQQLTRRVDKPILLVALLGILDTRRILSMGTLFRRLIIGLMET